ncbi:hypothetical protein [Shewanella cyperi]|uniref:hypothetical protein n=1 Tax=Shewanella cyperi TaxID=2814292 RepID=UPI001A942EE4|nr:hypothetical protein [Shewanella cyperi]QSX40666.1 hypothetical protein JYB84_17240 [Shewanella cyperi]
MWRKTLNTICKPALLLALLLAPLGLSAREYSQQDFIEAFSSQNVYKVRRASDALQFEGMGEPAIFANIATELAKLTETQESLGKQELQLSAWLMRALAYSGDPKFQNLLQEYTGKHNHKKLRQYAKEALSSFKQQQLWQPIINNRAHWDQQLSPRINALANGLRSGHLELMREAARTITADAIHHPFLLKLLSGELARQHYLSDEGLSVDTYAWMAKALASSGEAEYEPQLRAMADGKLPKSLRKYIKGYLKTYY